MTTEPTGTPLRVRFSRSTSASVMCSASSGAWRASSTTIAVNTLVSDAIGAAVCASLLNSTSPVASSMTIACADPKSTSARATVDPETTSRASTSVRNMVQRVFDRPGAGDDRSRGVVAHATRIGGKC